MVTLADNSLVMPNNAPNPGEVVVFWANGLGPVPYDETQPAKAGDMTSVPLEVFIGGLPAQVQYRGRNPCCVSLDQINVQIPPGVNTGCVVSVVMRIGNLVSNTATIPVASSGRVCRPTNPAISQSDVQRLMGLTSIRAGIISLERSMPRAGALDLDSFGASLNRYSGLPSLVLDEVLDVPAPGSCTVTQEDVQISGGTDWNDPTRAIPFSQMDVGSIVAIA